MGQGGITILKVDNPVDNLLEMSTGELTLYLPPPFKTEE